MRPQTVTPKCRLRVTIAALFSVVLPLTARSQQSPVEDASSTIQVKVNVVNILATVRDKHGALINSLTKNEFIVREDRQLQTIKYFARETDVPLIIGLLVDISNSQHKLIESEREAAYQFFNQVLRRQDLAFLITFGQNVELLQDFADSPSQLQMALDQMHGDSAAPGTRSAVPNRGGTVLYDAVHVAAADRLRNKTGRKIIVLITDGIDSGSKLKLEDAIKAAQQADTIIYSICYFDPSAYDYDLSSLAESDLVLRKMSGETGGRVFRVDHQHSLPKIFVELEQEVRSQYAIGYVPTNLKLDGSFRRTELRTVDRSLTVRARKGYYAVPAQQ